MSDDTREVCFFIADDGAVLWSDASTSPVALPDSRARWEALWALRQRVALIAHSHPGGPLAFSAEDETTMAAVDASLGRAMRWAVVTPEGVLVREGAQAVPAPAPEPFWVPLLRLASGLRPRG